MSETPTQRPARNTANYLRKRAIFVGVIVIFALASELTRDVREMYSARATIQVDQPMLAPNDNQVNPADVSLHWHTKRNTFVELISNTKLMEQVIRDHDLMNDVEVAGGNPGTARMGELARMLSNRTMARTRPETELIDIIVTHRNPRLARDLVNWIAQGFIKQQSNRSLQDHRLAFTILTNEADRLKLKLKNAEVALIEFRKTSNLVISLDERHEMVRKRIAAKNESLNGLVHEIARIEDDLELIRSYGEAPTIEQLRSVPSVFSNEGVQKLQHQLDIAQQLDLGNPSNPSASSTQPHEAMVQALESKLTAAIRGIPERLEQSLAILRINEQTTRNSLMRVEEESLELSAIAVEYHVLKREVTSTQSLLESVFTRIKELDLGPDPRAPVLRVVQEADSASNITPERNANAIEAALIALAISITAVFLFDQLRPIISRSKPESGS